VLLGGIESSLLAVYSSLAKSCPTVFGLVFVFGFVLLDGVL